MPEPKASPATQQLVHKVKRIAAAREPRGTEPAASHDGTTSARATAQSRGNDADQHHTHTRTHKPALVAATDQQHTHTRTQHTHFHTFTHIRTRARAHTHTHTHLERQHPAGTTASCEALGCGGSSRLDALKPHPAQHPRRSPRVTYTRRPLPPGPPPDSRGAGRRRHVRVHQHPFLEAPEAHARGTGRCFESLTSTPRAAASPAATSRALSAKRGTMSGFR